MTLWKMQLTNTVKTLLNGHPWGNGLKRGRPFNRGENNRKALTGTLIDAGLPNRGGRFNYIIDAY